MKMILEEYNIGVFLQDRYSGRFAGGAYDSRYSFIIKRCCLIFFLIFDLCATGWLNWSLIWKRLLRQPQGLECHPTQN